MVADVTQNPKRIVDAYLVTCAQLGDRSAQEQLVSRYQRKFLRHAYRLLGDGEQARDAVQDSWVEIVRGLSKLKDNTAFSAWAFRIVTRRCAKLIAGLQKSRRAVDAASDPSDPSGAATCAPARGDDPTSFLEMRDALAALPPAHRATVALFYLEDMNVAEVAVSLDIPAGTVKTRLMHARQKLRAMLTGEDDE